MFPFSEPSITSPSFTPLRNDILKPTSLGFMKEIPEQQVAKETGLSTIINDNLEILKTVTMPKHLDINEVSGLLQKIIENEVKNDPLHDVSVRLSKYANDFYNKMESYFAEIHNYEENIRKNLRSCAFANTKEYVISNIPPSYIREVTLSILTEAKYSEMFDYRIRRERLKLIRVRKNIVKFKKVCDEHNHWVDVLHSALAPMIDSRIRLTWYVDFHSSETAQEIFEMKKLKRSNLDDEHFFGLLLDLGKKTQELRQSLIAIDRETFVVGVDRKDPTADLLCNVMEIIGSHQP